MTPKTAQFDENGMTEILPLSADDQTFAFLQTRRSRPAKTLTGPYPSGATLDAILQAALRVPDHGKLEPWRLITLETAAFARLAAAAQSLAAAQDLPEDKRAKASSQFDKPGFAVAVVMSPVASEKVPEIEQILSAGALCQGLLNAAMAAGFGANWLTGWAASDRGFADILGLAAHESIAGFIHMGTETTPPPDRPRPKSTKITRIAS